MAGGRERILRRRIKSIQSTQKITRAQELIAASRIAKASAQVAAAQPYSETITQVVRDLAAGGGPSGSALLSQPDEIRKVGYIVVVGDRGLCGAYNSTVIRTAERAIAEQQRLGRDYSLVLAGRKAEGYFRYRDYRIDAAFSGFSQQPAFEDAASDRRAPPPGCSSTATPTSSRSSTRSSRAPARRRSCGSDSCR